VQTGRNLNTGTGVPNWNGPGLITTQTSAGASLATNLAVAMASDVGYGNTRTFGGATVSGTDTLVMYTYNGDANLSGKVDADDYFVIDSNYNKNGSVFGWIKGDFNYDGQINGDDYAAIDAGFAASAAGTIANSELPGGVSAVPEPASLSVLSLAAMSVLTRRRRK